MLRTVFKLTGLLAVLMTAQPAFAAQPFSTSLAQCAGQYQHLAQWMAVDLKFDQAVTMMVRFQAAAETRARDEGIADARAEVIRIMDAEVARWDQEGRDFFRAEDYLEWAWYCQAVGRDEGIVVN